MSFIVFYRQNGTWSNTKMTRFACNNKSQKSRFTNGWTNRQIHVHGYIDSAIDAV